jgi:hypothetical protein
MDIMHFQNFLGAAGTSLCGALGVASNAQTLDPARVTCERCLALLGRLGDGKFGLPTKKPDPTK